MSKGVGVNFFLDICSFCSFFYNFLNVSWSQFALRPRKKKFLFQFFLLLNFLNISKILLKLLIKLQIKQIGLENQLSEMDLEYNEKIENIDSESINIFNTEKKYRIIYADPPWSYNDKQDTPNLGGAIKHYKALTIDEICELPIKNLTEENSVLFLWVTSPFLEDSFKIIKDWGFKYKSSFIWDKVNHNMGHYNSVRHEFLLICTRGSCTPDNKKLFDSVQSIERTQKHSEKPNEFREIIKTIYTHGRAIELFSRTNVDGWDTFGNQV